MIGVVQCEDRLRSYGFECIGQFGDGQKIWFRETRDWSRLVILDEENRCRSYVTLSNKR